MELGFRIQDASEQWQGRITGKDVCCIFLGGLLSLSILEGFEVMLRFTLGTVHSVGLDQYIVTRIHYFNIIQNCFIDLKILCFSFSFLALSHHCAWQPLTDLFYCCHCFAFSRM